MAVTAAALVPQGLQVAARLALWDTGVMVSLYTHLVHLLVHRVNGI
tara:strand:- start:409 stop:546 length:138 start_codon:yes stop_codon:yes gene_type:complete